MQDIEREDQEPEAEDDEETLVFGKIEPQPTEEAQVALWKKKLDEIATEGEVLGFTSVFLMHAHDRMNQTDTGIRLYRGSFYAALGIVTFYQQYLATWTVNSNRSEDDD